MILNNEQAAALNKLLDELNSHFDYEDHASRDLQLSKAHDKLVQALDNQKTPLIITLEGGLVQDIVSPDPDLFRGVDVIVVDYDTENSDEDDVSVVEQHDSKEET